MSSPSRPDNYLSLRRADDGSVNSAVVCSLRYSPSSGRPTAPATPSLEGLTLKEARHPVSRSRRLSPTKRLFRSPTRPIPAAPPRKEASEVPEPVEGPKGHHVVSTIAR
ncbi:MAG: hypothetical protein J6T22_14065 [Bacteroidales bacterium]|nr:hypothetical protein [Bacteroidales bacterium]